MSKHHRFKEKKFRVQADKKLVLGEISTKPGDELTKKKAIKKLKSDIKNLKDAQEILYASHTESLLIIFQGMDAAGKDSTIRHVMGGINPQGCRVVSFKAPSETELEHHFLWRPAQFLPKRGMISLFNRSYYEEVLVVRVHPEFLGPQRLPEYQSLEELWEQRYEEIRIFEATMKKYHTHVLKFYLHVSKEEQKERFLDRLQRPDKHWKFNPNDLSERVLWPHYQTAFEQALANTSTEDCPWYIIPADSKWYARAAVADIISQRLESLDLKYPSVPNNELSQFDNFIKQLKND
jgi:PPK2 family polyphosphate:nucleotide phosphotransferase